ncbi:hypothetical protein Clacol_002705 [Clathrus columnatus]|uniref:Major facilitator superfamily (MFS) profile domain-containing protein n=1 Tax=Clathrus columnatus TaxID=1419009 RepID=A0AAV5A4U6_9AGAM|nr:hypothetical protein Clacol_002705 [Clathrus columnatus]
MNDILGVFGRYNAGQLHIRPRSFMDVKTQLAPEPLGISTPRNISTPTIAINNELDGVELEGKAELEAEKCHPDYSEPPETIDISTESLKGFQKVLLLGLLCSAQFFDIFNAASVIIALPEISNDIHFTSGALQWVLSAYTLTFAASFLLAGAALTFPSALAMIVKHYPDPTEQSRALAIFGGFGAIGNVVGFVLGGIITARLTWRWIFYIAAIIVTPFSILSFFVLPKHLVNENHRQRKLDWQGVVALAGGLILFVYGLTDGNNAGWKKPQIIVTLVFSIVLVLGFFFIERFVNDPAVPPSTWRIHNFMPLFVYCWRYELPPHDVDKSNKREFSLYWFVNGIEIQFIQIFQVGAPFDFWGWSPLNAAIHCLPIGITAGICVSLAGRLVLALPRKFQLVFAQTLMGVSAILFVFADTPDKYWTHVLPGMIICMIGTAVGYVSVNVFIMASAPKGQEGVIGAMMNTAFQLGATVGLASKVEFPHIGVSFY